MMALAARCGATGMPLVLAVRLEDGRQRHPIDGSTELAPWMVRTLIRQHPALRLIVTHGEREFVEQVHFGATPEEAARILWDITWIWGPPEDHLATLLTTVGSARFTFGSGMPLRLGETSVAKLDLLDLSPAVRARIESENVRAFARAPGR
jgi:predicted TIM-barrel fold metal-dependent hydrolase